jgi:serine phosphatase RsbU (regulator of sigma subunit)
MIQEDLRARVPLAEIARGTNEFFCGRDVGSKYATLTIVCIDGGGAVEYMNCGHVWPFLAHSGGGAGRLAASNPPVGLLPGAHYASAPHRLLPGDRIVLVSDGVTEAESITGEYFGEERLRDLVFQGEPVDEIFRRIEQFGGNRALSDDCTIVSVEFSGREASNG